MPHSSHVDSPSRPRSRRTIFAVLAGVLAILILLPAAVVVIFLVTCIPSRGPAISWMAPASADVFVSVEGTGEVVRLVRGSGLARARELADAVEAVEEFDDRVARALGTWRDLRRVPFFDSLLWDIAGREIGVWIGPESGGTSRAVLFFRVGYLTVAAERLLARFPSMFGVSLEREARDGATATSITASAGTAHYAFCDDLLVVSLSRALVEECVTTAGSAGEREKTSPGVVACLSGRCRFSSETVRRLLFDVANSPVLSDVLQHLGFPWPLDSLQVEAVLRDDGELVIRDTAEPVPGAAVLGGSAVTLVPSWLEPADGCYYKRIFVEDGAQSPWRVLHMIRRGRLRPDKRRTRGIHNLVFLSDFHAALGTFFRRSVEPRAGRMRLETVCAQPTGSGEIPYPAYTVAWETRYGQALRTELERFLDEYAGGVCRDERKAYHARYVRRSKAHDVFFYELVTGFERTSAQFQPAFAVMGDFVCFSTSAAHLRRIAGARAAAFKKKEMRGTEPPGSEEAVGSVVVKPPREWSQLKRFAEFQLERTSWLAESAGEGFFSQDCGRSLVNAMMRVAEHVECVTKRSVVRGRDIKSETVVEFR